MSKEIKVKPKTRKDMKADVIRERIIEKFIMMEFVKGNLNTEDEVKSMISVIQNKLDMTASQAGEFLRKAINA